MINARISFWMHLIHKTLRVIEFTCQSPLFLGTEGLPMNFKLKSLICFASILLCATAIPVNLAIARSAACLVLASGCNAFLPPATGFNKVSSLHMSAMPDWLQASPIPFAWEETKPTNPIKLKKTDPLSIKFAKIYYLYEFYLSLPVWIDGRETTLFV
jgi:hypothetical protein